MVKTERGEKTMKPIVFGIDHGMVEFTGLSRDAVVEDCTKAAAFYPDLDITFVVVEKETNIPEEEWPDELYEILKAGYEHANPYLADPMRD